jgi:hypothetical protein
LIVAAVLACGDGGAAREAESPTQSPAQVTATREASPRAVPGGPARTEAWTRATNDAIAEAEQRLADIVRREALADADETWMLAHAIVAFGRDAALADGTGAVAAILATARGDPPGFAGASKSGLARDPHPHHTLATLLAAGVPTGDLAGLVAAAIGSFERPRDGGWAEHAWTMRAIAEAIDRGLVDRELVNSSGERFDALELARAFADRVVADMRFLDDAKARREAVRKRGQGIWAHPCGGLHAIETVAAWLRVRDDAELRATLEHIRDTLAYRVGVEADLYAWMRREAPPELALALDAQELRFFGHVLDASRELARARVPLPGEVRDEATARLVAAVQRLAERGAFARLDALRTDDPQLYRDLVGDAAHAVAGLTD